MLLKCSHGLRNFLICSVGFPMLVRWHLYAENGSISVFGSSSLIAIVTGGARARELSREAANVDGNRTSCGSTRWTDDVLEHGRLVGTESPVVPPGVQIVIPSVSGVALIPQNIVRCCTQYERKNAWFRHSSLTLLVTVILTNMQWSHLGCNC